MIISSTRRGTGLLEGLLLLELLCLFLYLAHVGVIKLWRQQVAGLDPERFAYDGARPKFHWEGR